MKKFLIFFFLLSTLNFELSAIANAQDAKTTAAVMDLEAREGVPKSTAVMLSDYLRDNLFKSQKYVIVTRERMESVFNEVKFQYEGCTSKECIVRAGELLGARKMFFGAIGKLGGTYLITLKIIDVESGKVENSAEEQCASCPEDALLPSIENVVYKIMEEKPQPEAKDEKVTAAVMELEAREGVSEGMAVALSDYLRTQLFSIRKYTIVTRENMESILKEQQFQYKDCTSRECVIEVGKLLSVRKMFAGTVGKMGNTHLITLRIIDVESGKVENSAEEQCGSCPEDALLSSVTNISYKIVGLAPPEEKKGTGKLSVTSTPPGAKVFVDGKEIGTAPILDKEFAAGRRQVILVKAGYETQIISIVISPDALLTINPVLKFQVGSVKITSVPEGAGIKMDGEYKGITPLVIKDIPAGEHFVVIESETYKIHKMVAKIKPGKQEELNISLVSKQKSVPSKPETKGKGNGDWLVTTGWLGVVIVGLIMGFL